MAWIGKGARALRLVTLLREYLNTHVDVIDTGANAVQHAASPDDSFATESLASTDISAFTKTAAETSPLWVVVLPSYQSNVEEGRTMQSTSTTGLRLIAEEEFFIDVYAASSTASWGAQGAWLRADRIVSAIQRILLLYPQWDVPSLSLSEMVEWSRVIQTLRDPDQDIHATDRAFLRTVLSVRCCEFG